MKDESDNDPIKKWDEVIGNYNFPVNLSTYCKADKYDDFFNLSVGDRKTTIEFENRFQQLASKNIASWLEVNFWKVNNNQGKDCNVETRAEKLKDSKPEALIKLAQRFIETESKVSFEAFLNILKIGKKGDNNRGIALASTFISFLDSENFPIVDRHVAAWVDKNSHIEFQGIKLKQFKLDRDCIVKLKHFESFISWVKWCRKVRNHLKNSDSKVQWRARDIEMVVFECARKKIVTPPNFFQIQAPLGRQN